MKKIKLLIVSVGSLVGKCILDCIDSRRERFHVIGINSLAESPMNYRCDEVYLAPPINDERFEPWFRDFVARQQPDIILPGRDDDIVFLANFRANTPELEARIPCGQPGIAKIIRDKVLTYRWAKTHQLPFAESLWFDSEPSLEILTAFAERVGFPIIAKPKFGFGSRGVFILDDHEALATVALSPETIFQEFLGPVPDLSIPKQMLKQGVPLFFQVNDDFQYAAQTLIRPDGTRTPTFISISKMVLGRLEHFAHHQDAAIEALTEQYCTQLYKDGWVGPVNLQCRQDRQGVWKVHELNLRFSGGTSSRLLLGYDEIGNLLASFYPALEVPIHSTETHPDDYVVRFLSDYYLSHADIGELQAKGHWKKY
ncbi:MAG: hypothetical protein H6555_01975 [Lewinellaceae bacterium]|nr:hypothetical protein [Lewinellaceae bacterium]